MSHDFRPEQDPYLDDNSPARDFGWSLPVGFVVFVVSLAAFGALVYLARVN